MKRLATCLLAAIASTAAPGAVVYVPIYTVVTNLGHIDVIPPAAGDYSFQLPVDCLAGGRAMINGLSSAGVAAESEQHEFAVRLSAGMVVVPALYFSSAAVLMQCSCCGSSGAWATPGTEGYLGASFLISGQSYYGWIRLRRHTSGAFVVLDAAYESGPSVPIVVGAGQPACESADFNHDGDAATDADIEAFFSCLAGQCCALCGSADFNRDGDTATDADIEAFFRVLAGGNC